MPPKYTAFSRSRDSSANTSSATGRDSARDATSKLAITVFGDPAKSTAWIVLNYAVDYFETGDSPQRKRLTAESAYRVANGNQRPVEIASVVKIRELPATSGECSLGTGDSPYVSGEGARKKRSSLFKLGRRIAKFLSGRPKLPERKTARRIALGERP